MIVGTAGHIDHGKTALVRALTGIDTDRLQEEKRRGITIELGFAHLELADGSVLGVVDVPGHERFVKTMAAGAGGVDVVLLVVACDEGVMPQTREHLDICQLLGVKAGIIALTKADLLPALGAEWASMLREDVKALVQGSVLEGAPLVPVSAHSGEGLDTLRAELLRLAQEGAAAPIEGPLFLPIDRAFSVRGFGTVVTGTVLSGQLARDEWVSLLPDEGPYRVRGLQGHGVSRERVSAGHRAAVNLVGVEAERVSRGCTLTRHGELIATRLLDVELFLLPAADKPLPRRSRLRLHLGTHSQGATVALLDAPQLAPGHSAVAQLRLAEPVAAVPGQHFILRGPQPLPGRGATLAGGRVLTTLGVRRRRGGSAVLQALSRGSDEERLLWFVHQAGYRGMDPHRLRGLSGLAPPMVSRGLELLGARGQVVLLDRERRLFVSGEVLKGLVDRAQRMLEAHRRQDPTGEGIAKEELRQRLGVESERLFARVVAELVAAGTSKSERADRLGAGEASAPTEAESGLTEVVGKLEEGGLAPPTVLELAQRTRFPERRVEELLSLAVRRRLAVKVGEGLFFHPRPLESLRAQLVAHLTVHREISTQEFKQLVGGSRKFVIPLSEYFDKEKVTLRVGQKRVLRRG